MDFDRNTLSDLVPDRVVTLYGKLTVSDPGGMVAPIEIPPPVSAYTKP